MSENNALAIPDIVGLQKAKFADDGFGDLSGPGFGNFLPYLQLCGSSTELAKRGDISVGNYALISGSGDKKEHADLGKNVICIPVAWRPKAMNAKATPVIVSFTPTSPLFQQLRKTAENDSRSGCMFGPEFLLWIPGHGFATFHMGSKTARNEARSIQALLPGADGRLKTANLSAQFIKTEKHSWHGPKCVISSQVAEQPAPDVLLQAVTDFLNPVDSKPPEAAAPEVVNQDR